MNKLYKYLPFDIQLGIYEKSPDSLKIELITKTLTYKNINEFVNGDYINYKPILRPLEPSNLLQRVPATKAASKLLGVAEGELLYILSVYHTYMGRDDNYAFWINRRKGADEQFPLKYKEDTYHGGYYSSGTMLLSTALTSQFIEFSPKSYEKGLDFLRAMYFNLDFEEGEYIQLT